VVGWEEEKELKKKRGRRKGDRARGGRSTGALLLLSLLAPARAINSQRDLVL